MPALIERPKMSRAMWEGLKAHILRERQKKKQEQEADAALERIKRERENKQKQDVMTLEETKEQIAQLQQKSAKMKEEKHQLFLQLKKVLNEDETKRRQLTKEANEQMAYAQKHYSSVSIPKSMVGQQGVYVEIGRSGNGSPVYQAKQLQSNQLPVGQIKRARSPSPPTNSYNHPYNYKAQAVAAYGQKQPNFIPTSHYYGTPNSVPISTNSHQPSPSQPTPSNYRYGPTAVHQSIERPTAKGHTSIQEDKFYSVQQHSIRAVTAPIHHVQPLMPIQQAQKAGGITSGYPTIRQPQSATPVLPYQTPPQQTTQQHPGYEIQGTPRVNFGNYPPSSQGRYY